MSNYSSIQAGLRGTGLKPPQAVRPSMQLTHDQVEALRREAMRLRAETINSYVLAVWATLHQAVTRSRRAFAGKVAVAADAAESGSPKSAGSR